MSMNKALGYLICETASTEPEKPNIITVSSDNRVQIEACVQDMNAINRNRRFYASEDLAPQLKDKRIVELLETGNLFGEAGHPTSQELLRQQTIDPNNMSHLFHKLWTNGNKIMAHISAANTRVGDDFHRLVISGTKVSFSLRAMGVIKQTNRGAEVKNIRIITWDWVIFPSHQAAYMDKIINIGESALMGETNRLMLEKTDSGLIIPIYNQQVTDYIKSQSANLKNVVESFEFMYDKINVNENARSISLTDSNGDTLVVHVEQYIQDEIMNFCAAKR